MSSQASQGMPLAIMNRAKTTTDPETEFMGKLFKLESRFQANLLETIESNFKLQFLSACKGRSKSDFSKIEMDSLERWQKLIYFLLNIEQSEEDYSRQTYSELLAFANYYDSRTK